MRELIVATWNVATNGIDPDGNRRRRDVALEVLHALKPHILLRVEEHRAWDNDATLRDEEARRLGLASYVAPYSAEKNSPTAVLFDPDLFQFEREKVWHSSTYKPLPVITVRMRGAIRPLTLTSLHLHWCDPVQRATTARRLTTLIGETGGAVLFGGDMNSFPHRDPGDVAPLPDMEMVADRAHVQHRTIERGGRRVPDTLPDEILAGSGVFAELGHHAYSTLGQAEAIKATGSLWRTDQGERRRIDRLYTTPDLTPALRAVSVNDDEMVSFASDHALVIARFNLDTFREALRHTPHPATLTTV